MVKVENEYAMVLYKKSFTSYSKTCTSISNQTRVMKKTSNVRMKPTHHKVFYADKGKIKRDLSIETDLCKIRRRFKQRLTMLTNADEKLAYTARVLKSPKSNNSTYTQEYPIDEFRSDNSGCGNINQNDPHHCCMNKEDLMYDNLNELFKTWIEQTLQDKDLKLLIKTAFGTATKKSESKKEGKSSSCTTYLLEDNKTRTSKNSNSSGAFPPSSYTEPIIHKALRLISTLSVPKNMDSRKRQFRKFKTKIYRMKKRDNRKMLFTLLQSKKNIDEESDINIGMIEVVTKSWLRRCVNVDGTELNGSMFNTKPQIVYLADFLPSHPNIMYKYTKKNTGQKDLTNNDNHKEMKHTNTTSNSKKNYCSNHGVKHYSGGDTILKKHCDTEYSCQKTSIQTSTMLQGASQRDPMVKLDIYNDNLCCPDIILKKKQRTKTCCKVSKQDIGILCKRSKSSAKFANNRMFDKQFTRVDKRVKKNTKENMMNNLQNAINCIVNNTNKNFKFDLHMSVSPMKLNTYQHAATDARKTTKYYVNRSVEALYKIKSITTNNTTERKYQKAERDQSHSPNNIDKPNPESINSKNQLNEIPLVDGAASKTEYVFKIDRLTTNPENILAKLPTNENIQVEASMTKELGLKDEIIEIKLALRNITLLVNTCLASQYNKKHLKTPKSKRKSVVDVETISKPTEKLLPASPISVPGIKITRNKIKYSGIKLSKEGRKSHSSHIDSKPDPKGKNPSIENKMNVVESYRIIESESLIEVTNMTPCTGQKGSSNTTDVALTCSLPEKRSLYEISGEKLQKKSFVLDKHDLALQTESSVAKNEKSSIKRNRGNTNSNHSSYGSEPASSVISIKCNTPKHMSGESVNEKHSTTNNTFSSKNYRNERQNVGSYGTVNSMFNRQTVGIKSIKSRCLSWNQKNNKPRSDVLYYHSDIRTNKCNLFICDENCVAKGALGRKHKACGQKTLSTKTNILPNNVISCHQSRNTSQRNITYQKSLSKTNDCCQNAKLIDNINIDTPQKGDSLETSFWRQSIFATKAKITGNTDDSIPEKQNSSDINTIEKAYSTEQIATRLSQTNANDTITTNKNITNSVKDLIHNSVSLSAPSEKTGVNIHIKKSESLNKTVSVNLGNESNSNLKSTRNRTISRWIKLSIVLILSILMISTLATSYVYFVDNDITLKRDKISSEKARSKILSYVNLNVSELGF